VTAGHQTGVYAGVHAGVHAGVQHRSRFQMRRSRSLHTPCHTRSWSHPPTADVLSPYSGWSILDHSARGSNLFLREIAAGRQSWLGI